MRLAPSRRSAGGGRGAKLAYWTYGDTITRCDNVNCDQDTPRRPGVGLQSWHWQANDPMHIDDVTERLSIRPASVQGDLPHPGNRVIEPDCVNRMPTADGYECACVPHPSPAAGEWAPERVSLSVTLEQNGLHGRSETTTGICPVTSTS